jgi:hypothetical protein
MTTTTRTEHDGFTYVAGCAYETDPATVVSIVAGDTISVVDSVAPVAYWMPAAGKPRTFVVERVGRDEFGLYFHGTDGQYANTIINQIARV